MINNPIINSEMQSTRDHFSLIIITLFPTLALVPFLAGIFAVIIRCLMEARRKQSTKNKNNQFEFDGGFEKYDEIIIENEVNNYYKENLELEKYKFREYEKINYDEMNNKQNRIVEYTQILE